MNRRQLFALAALALLACGNPPPPLPLPPLRHLDAAREVGRAWLEDSGEPRDPTAFSRGLLDGFQGNDPQAFTQHLLQRHQADLEAARTTRVQGWLLSRTEASLYAWLALS